MASREPRLLLAALLFFLTTAAAATAAPPESGGDPQEKAGNPVTSNTLTKKQDPEEEPPEKPAPAVLTNCTNAGKKDWLADLANMAGQPVVVGPGDFPVGIPATLTIDLDKAEITDGVGRLNFKVWAQSIDALPRSQNAIDHPIRVDIGSVTYDGTNNDADITLLIDERAFSVGWSDHFRFTVIGCVGEQVKLRAVFDKRVTSRTRGLVWAGFIGALAIGAVLWFVKARSTRERMKWGLSFTVLFADFRDKVSLTRIQVALFTLVVALAVTYAYALTGLLTDLSTDVLLLLGIAAGSATVANAGDNQRQRLDWDSWVWLEATAEAIDRNKSLEKLSFSQAITTHGRFDVFRFQALVFSVIVSVTLLTSAVGGLGDLTIPDGILAVLGLSQVTYLGGKFVAPPTVEDFEKDLKAFRTRLEQAPDEPRNAERVREIRKGFEAVFGYPPAGKLLAEPKAERKESGAEGTSGQDDPEHPTA